ncbi:hypothetical protein M5D96_002707 [Drosophila gunungcola]|uniref:Uncharacterized protein n=1 Tax=Drosophila gunungcola TaxID=103775 RepID=A0A9P9Z0I1_9MUSC|nr:hypothetical protein M5D96_002707 [Drosophila gunungcola]
MIAPRSPLNRNQKRGVGPSECCLCYGHGHAHLAGLQGQVGAGGQRSALGSIN